MALIKTDTKIRNLVRRLDNDDIDRNLFELLEHLVSKAEGTDTIIENLPPPPAEKFEPVSLTAALVIADFFATAPMAWVTNPADTNLSFQINDDSMTLNFRVEGSTLITAPSNTLSINIPPITFKNARVLVGGDVVAVGSGIQDAWGGVFYYQEGAGALTMGFIQAISGGASIQLLKSPLANYALGDFRCYGSIKFSIRK